MRRNPVTAREAAELFHGKEKYNCVQAIMKAFQPRFGVSEDAIAAGSSLGSGRAPGGLCGALYAVKLLAGGDGLSRIVEERFVERAGAADCRTIRKLKRLSCRQCVEAAAEILEASLSCQKA